MNKNTKIALSGVGGAVHALGLAMAFHSAGWNAHGLVVVCLAYGGATFLVLRRAFPS